MYVFITLIHVDLLLSFALFTWPMAMAPMGDNTNYLISFPFDKTENEMLIKTGLTLDGDLSGDNQDQLTGLLSYTFIAEDVHMYERYIITLHKCHFPKKIPFQTIKGY